MEKYGITINRDLCIGAGTCNLLAGSTFGLDAECKAILLNSDGDDYENIKRAADSCPTGSILIEE